MTAARRPRGSRWRWLVVAAVVVLIYGGLAFVQRQAQPADFTPVAVGATFDDQAQLLGFHLEDVQPDGVSEVALTWLALNRPRTDYKVFLHLVDQNGELWAQNDGEPGYFFSPTTRWQRGEVVDDRHELIWREDASPPPGRYSLFVGLYDPATGARLPILAAAGRIVNAIPAVVAAPPGIRTTLDLPLVSSVNRFGVVAR